ncbi:MAG: hypothetical protein QXH35_06050 [Nitrososphaerota archaeon]
MTAVAAQRRALLTRLQSILAFTAINLLLRLEIHDNVPIAM